MTIGEIKVESLKLMFANNEALSVQIAETLSSDEDILAGKLEGLALDPNYSDYMCKMNSSIARAMKRIEVLEKSPLKYTPPISAVQIVDANGDKINAYHITMDNVEDYYRIEAINKADITGVYLNQPYQEIGHGEFLVEGKGLYIIVYAPKLPTYTDITPDSTEIPLPDNIAMLIPYFVKGELLEQEEPSMAANAMQYFENALYDIINLPSFHQKRVKRVFT